MKPGHTHKTRVEISRLERELTALKEDNDKHKREGSKFTIKLIYKKRVYC